MTYHIRLLEQNDIPIIVKNFLSHNWAKPRATFDKYLLAQQSGERLIWVAYDSDQFAGYVTLKWESEYPSFYEKNIPEIMDLNVLPPFRSKGIGSALLEIVENEAYKKCDVVGLGVGLYSGYGAAQRLYITRGYMPDGEGITYNYKRVEPGETVCLDDDLVLWLTKKVIK